MNWKKRMLALVLVLVMVMNLVPFASAQGVKGSSNSDSSFGSLGLTAQSGIKQDTGFAGQEGLTKYENSGLLPFSESEKLTVYAPDDLVTFVVVLESEPLLARYSSTEIGQQTEAVVAYTQMLMEQIAAVQAQVEAAFGNEEGYEMGFTYTIGSAGFSVTTAYKNLSALKALENVKSAYVAPVYSVPESRQEDFTALTSNSSNMIGADILNQLGYTGKGQRIAILDTGIDVEHPSFAALADDVLVDPLTRDDVQKVWDQLNAGQMTNSLNLSYYNSKLPFIFNYSAGNFNVANTYAGSDHGTHVAGIAAANRLDNTEVVGMAPDAQLVVMQVFQQGGGAAWPTIMAALEDCILLEVDTVNLSLGSAAGFYDPDGQMKETLNLFLNTDIQVLIASGNDTNNAYMNNWGYDMSLLENPDIGLAGTPSTYSAALAVASVDNDGYEQYYITVNGTDFGFMDTALSSATGFLSNFRDMELEYVVVPGVGELSDYEGLDVTGKVALVSRGTISFMEKQANAQEMGAVACLVYNNDRNLFAMQINDGPGNIPAVAISREAGAYMVEVAGEAGVGTFKVCNADTKIFKVPQTVSSFSSWGVTPDLKLKPEIAGVGGSVYSTVSPDISGVYYGYMSGTSMACPQVAGAMAVLLQYLDENFPEITGAEQRRMAANLLMSTANPVMYSDYLEYSPRAQGAGLADLLKATTAAAYLSNPAASEGRAKVEFGDDPERTGVFTFSFTITNISNEAVSYTFDSSVMTESIYAGYFIANAPYGLEAKVELPEQVEVAAGETVTVDATLTLTENDIAYLEQFPNGIYVEGYLYANPTSAEGVTLSMPMVGFYGDWSDAPVFDNDQYGYYSLYPKVVYTYYSELGQNPYFRNGESGDEFAYISYKNLIDEIDIGMLRNAKYLYISVTDKNNPDVLYYEIAGSDLAKTYFSPNYGMIIPFYLLSGYGEIWDGTDMNGNTLPDGTTVVYSFEAWLDDGDEEVDDVWSFEVTIDDTTPELVNDNDLQSAMRVDGDRTYLTLEILENERVAAVIFMSPNGTVMGKYEVHNVPGELYTAEYDITGFGGEFTIIVADYACNETEVDVYLNLGDQNNAVPQPQALDPNRLYGSETFDSALVEAGWFSANKVDFSDPQNETFDTSNRYYSAEYVNGYIIAQSVLTGNLELITPSGSYWSSKVICQNNGSVGASNVWVLYDMALDHSGTLAASYGMNSWGTSASDGLFAVGWLYAGDLDNDSRDDGYNALFYIKFSDDGNVNVETVGRIAGTGNGADMLTLGITTEGEIYGIDTNAILYSIGKTTDWDPNAGQYGDSVINCTPIGATSFVNYPNYAGANVIQSMGYDHNTGTMYWYAHTQVPVGYYYENVNVTYTVNLETAECTEVGTYGPGGQTSLFVPNDLESDLFVLGVEATGMEITPYQVTLVEGQSSRLKINWKPWNAAPGSVTWESLDPSIVTVDEYGFIQALQPGETTITASTEMMLDGYWEVTDAGDWIWHDPGMGVKTVSCSVRVVDSQDELYGFLVEDYNNSRNSFSWITYSDKNPTEIVNLGGNGGVIWTGGTYYNGYVYMVTQESFEEDGVFYSGTSLYRAKVTQGETPAETVIGEPEFVGFQDGMLISAMSFDYNTGRMYCVENQYVGGLGIIDLDTGKVDMLGWPNGDLYGGVYIPGLVVTRDGTIVISDAVGSIYTIDPDTLTTKMLYSGNGSPYTAFYEAMCYDYNNDVIYYNMCDGTGASPLYMIILEEQYGQLTANMINLGGVSTKGGVQQTVMFVIPDEEPETHHIPVESIDITNGDKIIGLEGGQLKLDVITNPARPTLQKKTWTSSDESVVTVDEFGKLTYVGVGTATITVSITNKDEEAHGGPFTDSIVVEVVEAAGEFVAFLNADENATGYFDFWLKGSDFDLRHMSATQSMISIYSLRAGTYYDGYFYGYNDKGQFMRIDADNLTNYKVLGNANLDYNKYQVTAMAMDYTTGTMYGLTLTSNYDYEYWMEETHVGQLVTIDLDTGLMTAVADLDFNEPVFALACDKDGQLYAAGGSMDMYANSTTIYKMDKETAALTPYTTVEGANVFTGSAYYGMVRYNTQLTYDFGTNRLYMNATVNDTYRSASYGVFMIQLGDEPVVASLGGISLWTRGAYDDIKYGDVYLALMAFIPDAEEIPVGEVNGIILNKTSGRVAVGETAQMVAQVRPSNAADTSVTWTSSDPSVATVDENGLITGVSEGVAIITVTSNQTGVSSTCLITVTNVTGAQNMAYTVSAQLGAVVSFNPAMPAQTAQVLTNINAGANVKGMAYGEDCLYLLVYIDYGTYLYKFDFATNKAALLGQIDCWFEPSGLAYDIENDLFYVTGGFYLFQYNAATLDPNNYNYMTNYVMDSEYCTLVGVAVVDGAVYTFGTEYYDSIPQMMKYSDMYLNDRTVVLTNIEVPLVSQATDVTYDAGSGLFYFADPGHTIYAMDMDGNVVAVDILGEGLDLYGFAIDPTAKFQITYTDGVEGQQIFRDQFFFAAEGAETPKFVGTPVREGYTFVGWSPVVSGTVSGDTVYEAVWSANTYEITFDVSGGELDNRTMSVTFDQPIGEMPVPTRAGYTFQGWIDRMGNVYTAETIYNVAGDQFMIAVWTPNQYTITLDPNGGELEANTITVTFGELITELPVPTRDGFTFVGWLDENGNKVLVGSAYETAADSTLTAQWSANAYTITLDPNGGEVDVTTITVEYGAAVNTLPVPTLEGYIFLGWFDAEGNEYTAETVYTVAGDVTLTAQWEKDPNPPTGGVQIYPALLIAAITACAVITLTNKRKEEEN